MQPARVAIVSIPASIEGYLRHFLKNAGTTEVNFLDYRKEQKQKYDLVLIGSFGDSAQGLAAVPGIRSANHRIPLILLTDNGSESVAIAALRLGFTDYFSAPFDWALIALAIERHLGMASPEDESGNLAGAEQLVGTSGHIHNIRRYVARIARAPSNVLITGETGTGKEVVAQLIHRNSSRAREPLVCINCASLPEALLESELFGHERGAFTGAVTAQPGKLRVANGGTVMLDEIGEMSLAAQSKLLRAIETRQVVPVGGLKPLPVDVRFVAATNQELEKLVEERRFRKDLYFRLNVCRLVIEPLRKRVEDIPVLVDKFVEEFNRVFDRRAAGFTTAAMDRLLAHSWPGNVRELRNVVEAVFASSSADRFPLEALPPLLRLEGDAEPLTERERLSSALTSSSWNKSKAAKALNCSRMTLYRKMSKYRLSEAAPEATVTS